MELMETSDIKSYGDTYLYNRYPEYTKKLTQAIMQDEVIDKSTDAFKDVIYEIKRTRVSDALVRVLNSSNVILLNCAEPLPRAFKVFCARDFKSKDKKTRIFIDCTGVITKAKNSGDLIVEETKLVSHLINAAMCMIYHKANMKIVTKGGLVQEATGCFANAFTHIIDYLLKISIQESSKIKTLYISSLYFLQGILNFSQERAMDTAKKIANISDREATIINILIDKASHQKELKQDINPFLNINIFIKVLRDVMHFNVKAISTDIVIERWMQLYGPSTVMALEYFPALSAMMTDAYVGGFLNAQKTIENVCKTNMVTYAKNVISLIDSVV